MRKIKNPWINKEGYHCFGCCPDNPIGIHMEFYEDGDDILSFWNPHQHYQGWIDTMHGGILSTIIDEIAGWVVLRKLQTCGVTSRLEVSYRKPIMTTEPQIIENSQGEICTSGTATYFTFDKERSKSMGFTSCDLDREELLSM